MSSKEKTIYHPETKEHEPATPSQLIEGLPNAAIYSHLLENSLLDLETGIIQLPKNLNKPTKAIFDYLLATEQVIESDNFGFKLVIENSLDPLEVKLASQFIKAAVSIRKDNSTPKERLETLSQLISDLDLREIHTSLQGAFALPFIGELYNLVEDSGQPIQNLLPTLPESLNNFLIRADLIDQDQSLTPSGRQVFTKETLPGYIQLAYSYIPYYANLSFVLEHPELVGWETDIDRLQPDNARASNKLISKAALEILNRIPAGELLLDLGSGGGYLLKILSAKFNKVIGFDLSKEANKQAKRLFAAEKKLAQKLLKPINGNLLKEQDLRLAASFSPDMVTINYILHDLIGRAENYDQALVQLEDFLRMYKEIFPNTPILISESYQADAATQIADGNPLRAVFHLHHGISPQHLFYREDLIAIALKLGFTINFDEEITYSTHKDGSKANSALVLR